MPLSRGARRCLSLLQFYASKHSEVFPYRATIAKRLGVSYSQCGKYLQELKSCGKVEISQCGPHPASYHVVAEQNEQASSKLRVGFEQAFEPHIGSNSLQSLQASVVRKPMAVEIPDEYIENEYGRRMLNPAYTRYLAAARRIWPRAQRADNPGVYLRAALARELSA